MVNARDELLEKLNGRAMLCAEVHHYRECGGATEIHQLKTGEEASAFLAKLDFEYDEGYGRQYIGGCVWILENENLTSLTRYEHDGAEFWVDNLCQPIPKRLVQSPWGLIQYGGNTYLINDDGDVYPMASNNIKNFLNWDTIQGMLMTLHGMNMNS